MNARTPFNASTPVQLDPEDQEFLDTQKAAIDKARARLADATVDDEDVEAPPVVISEETEKALNQFKIGQLIESDADPKKNFIHPTDYNRVDKIWGKDDFDHDFGKFHDEVTPGLVHVTHKSNPNIHYTLRNGSSMVGMPDNVTQYDIQMAARKMVAFAAAHNSKECTISGHPDLQYWLWREAATAGITITNINAADLAIFKERMAKEMAHTGAVRNVAAVPVANYGDGMQVAKKPVNVQKEPVKEPPAPPVAVAPAGQSDVMFRAQHKAVQKITQGPGHAVKVAAQNAASRIRFEHMAAEQKAAAEKMKKEKREAANAKRRARRAEEKKRAEAAKAAREAREQRKAEFQVRAKMARAAKPRPV